MAGMKDWSQVCPNCNGTGMDHFCGKGAGTCLCCEGTGDFDTFLYLLMSGQITRHGMGWIPDVEFDLAAVPLGSKTA